MKLDVKEIGAVSAIHVKGNLIGGAETLALHEKVKELLAQKRSRIIIDLSGVTWINSSGLGMLMGCLTSVKNANGEMKLTGVTEKVKNLFVITKLITLFDVFESVQEAVDTFGNQ
jgi:anti-sigma B factor antagonist